MTRDPERNRRLNLDSEAFLARHWQRQPLFLPQAVPDFRPPLSRHELAGLAMEEGVEARIIEHRDGAWLLRHGPFSATDFDIPTPFNLLVQAVDHHVPEVAELRRLVDFLPVWRVDDVMVSYGADGASVGPHFDNYDVFLLQGEGAKVWRTGQFCDADADLLPHGELRILARFDTEQEYHLRTGDVLYVPPGIAHWGIARGDSTTFSIGFRAPRINDMVSRWVDQLLEQLEPEDFYRDPGQSPATRAGEIRPRDLERAAAQLQGALDQAGGDQWFGELVTEPRDSLHIDSQTVRAGLAALDTGATVLELAPGARLAWQLGAEAVTVYANGSSAPLPLALRPWLERLCGEWSLRGEHLRQLLDAPDGRTLVHFLLEHGCIHVQ